jgi:oxygen-independent coproporphyrinogen-3 oxidase
MRRDELLDDVRRKLFYGLLDYTKSFPDFCIPQRFSTASPKEAGRLLEDVGSSLSGERQLLLYVHLPFCSSECVFCNAFPRKASRSLQEQYVEGLLQEIEIYSRAGIFSGKELRCVYFGGGTPTAFENADLQRILGRLEARVDFCADCSITSEAHPRDLVENGRLEELAELGVNRVSMGCQTFDPKVLELCQRANSESEVGAAVETAKALGMSPNVDMMLGLPGQTLDGVKRDLDILSELKPDSIEYMRHEIVNPLAISLYRNDPELLVRDDDLFWMVYHTQAWMGENGYQQNGSFEDEKQFPYRYHWLEEMPFIALGSRSRSCTKSICFDKHDDLSVYLRLASKEIVPAARYMVLDKKEQMYRSLFLSIQLKRGLNLEEFATRFGEEARTVFGRLIGRLEEAGCIGVDESALKLNEYGRYFVEDVCCFIIDHALREWGYDKHLGRVPHSSGGLLEALSSRLRAPQSR